MNRDWYEKFDQAIREVEILQSALDRVRALCDETERHPGKPWHVLSTAEVRAALDGDQ